MARVKIVPVRMDVDELRELDRLGQATDRNRSQALRWAMKRAAQSLPEDQQDQRT